MVVWAVLRVVVTDDSCPLPTMLLPQGVKLSCFCSGYAS